MIPLPRGGTTWDFLDVVWEQALAPADCREIWEYITEEGELPGCYAVPGRFDVDLVPFVKEPFRALRNPLKREVVAMSAVQCLKTLIGELWLLWLIENDPGSTQWLQPTDDEGKEHAEERFIPLIMSFPRIARFFTGNKNDKKIARIIFKHMWMLMEGCGLTNLQRKSIKNQMCSEVWQKDHWVPGRLAEAAARQTQFKFNKKRYIESQPGEVVRDQDHQIIGDDILMAFNKWSQQEWAFRCEDCRKLQPYHFSFMREDGTRAAIRWDKNERTQRANGQWRPNELRQTIRYECIYCGHKHQDEPLTRSRMMASGDYIIGNPDAAPEGDSFTWNQLCMPGLPWLDHVQEFLFAIDQAKKGFDLPLRLFLTKKIGKPYDAEKHAHFTRLPTVEIQLTSEATEIVYEGVKFDIPMMGVDVQENHFWLLVQYWNASGDILTVWAEEVYTWREVRERQIRFKVPDQDVMVDWSQRGAEVVQNCTMNGHWEWPDPKNNPDARHWMCWKAMRGADRQSFTYVSKKRQIQLLYAWPPANGNPVSGLRTEDPRRIELSDKMKAGEIGRFCPIITWARPSVMEIALARRDGKPDCKLFTARGEWNDVLHKHWFSQKKIQRNGRWRFESYRADHLLDCFQEIIVRASMKQILGWEAGAPIAEAKEEPTIQP
jgi:hypothetical protein